MTEHWTDRLSEYHDGELAPEEQAACQAHLSACQECRDVLGEIQSVVALAQHDADRLPSTDLWPGILGQLESRDSIHSADVASLDAVFSRRTTGSTRRQFTFSLPQLALAASLLVAVSAGVSYVAAGRGTSRPPVPQEVPIQAMAEPMMASSSELTPANFADEQFDRAVADLERILIDLRDELDPRTVVVIERNLAVIDEAIRQARAALDADPANTFLNSHLADARRRKLDLLRRATSLSSGTGD